jgi:hypothetical protein
VLQSELDDILAQAGEDSEDEGQDMGREACILAALGRSREARDLALGAEKVVDGNPQTLMILAEVHALIGDPGRAVALLEQSFEAGYEDPYFILTNPPLYGIQSRPEIDELAPYR